MANLTSLQKTDKEIPDAFSLMVNKDTIFIIANLEIDTEAEKIKIEEEIKYLEGFMFSIDKKLSNESFVSNAPAQVVEKERQKYADAQQKSYL
jgi:valyl-tRNA synthetase